MHLSSLRFLLISQIAPYSLSLALLLPQTAQGAEPGDLDASFGGTGLVTSIAGGAVSASGTVLQSDGKLIVVGGTNSTNSDIAVSRFSPDGTLDLSFGNGQGVVTTDVAGDFDKASAVTIQPDGKIVVVGAAESGDLYNVAVLRYNADGSPDTTFDTDGKLTTHVGTGNDEAHAVTLQADGKIVVVGYSTGNFSRSTQAFLVLRYEADGVLDSSFSDDGMETVEMGTEGATAYGVAIQQDGKIVLAGLAFANARTGYDFAIARFQPGGGLDTSFGGLGKVFTEFHGVDGAHAVTLQPDGKILVCGTAQGGPISSKLAMARYHINGNLDIDFGMSGKVTEYLAYSGTHVWRALTLQPDGKILLAGQIINDTGGYSVLLSRYTSRGRADEEFGLMGRVVTNVDPPQDCRGLAMALQPDGKVVVGGTISNGAFDRRLLLLRYHGKADTPVPTRPPDMEIWQKYETEALEAFNFYISAGQPNLAYQHYYGLHGLAQYQYFVSLGDQANAEFNLYFFKGQSLKYLYLSQGKPKLGRYFQFLNLAQAHKRFWILKGNPRKGQQLFVKYRTIALRARR